jgi:uncharacterized protein YbjT (DUF2867 family)
MNYIFALRSSYFHNLNPKSHLQHVQAFSLTGATGIQGSGVIDALAKNPDWKIRGLPRNTNSEKAKALVNRGIEMVAANLDDEKSLIEAFNGVNAVFAVRDFYESFVTGIGPEKAMESEYGRGVNLARAAAETTTLK